MSMITDETICAEMLVHVPMCTHQDPKKILVISSETQISTELARYDEISYEVISQNFLQELEKKQDESFDLVIVYADETVDTVFVAQINRVLNAKGLFVCKTNVKKELMMACTHLFGIVMPYKYTKTKSFDEVVLASKLYHPTADILLQRSDLLEGVSYYNTEVHLGSFALPNFERKELAGIYKQ